MEKNWADQSIIEFWVFSYNRGTFLQNCINSLEECLPKNTSINIFDDDSDDPDTLKTLAKIAKKHRVVAPKKTATQSKHGGLYGNMQALLDDNTINIKSELVCCLQDDMQMVRPIDMNELLAIKKLFTEQPRLGFVHPSLLKETNKISDAEITRFSLEANGYYVDRYKNSAGAFYSDIFIANISRLKLANWTFSKRESGNEKSARKYFEQMIYLRNPFLAWLPNVPAFRGKQKTFAMKLAQKQQKSDFHPIRIMTPKEQQNFINRPTTTLPYAEQFLRLCNGQVKMPWTYYPLQGRKWLKKLNQIELAIRKVNF